MLKPSILLVIEGTYPWYRGGVSEWVHQYIRHFKNVDFQVLQVATDQYLNSDIDHALYNIPDNITRFERIPPPDLMKDWREESNRWFKSFCDRFNNFFDEVNLVHIANTGFAGWLGMKLAKLKDKPLVLTEHALYWKEVDLGAAALECGYKIPDLESEKNRMTDMFKSLAADIYKQSNEVVSVSKYNIPFQEKLGSGSVNYIPNGVEKEWLNSAKKRNTTLTIGWIGRCAEMKNPLKFFALVEEFRKSDTVDAAFIMMSCDANEPGLQLQIEDKLTEYPEVQFVWNEASEKHLSAMDALCITSHNESQPLVLFEAISKRVLPIGWKAGDVTEEFGLILPEETSPKKLMEEVTSLWSEGKKWDKKIDRLYEKVKYNHTWNHIFDDYRTLFSNFI